MTPGEHRAAAEVAYQAAQSLYQQSSAWHVVTLHYAALHWLHAHLDDRDDIPEEMRCPGQHRSRWGIDGRKAWGINDVVRERYPREVSGPFSSLAAGSHVVRYSAPVSVGDRFWLDYRRFRDALM